MFTMELAELAKSEGITVNALHPGSLLDTKLVRESAARPRGTVQDGADAIIFLATSPQVEGVTGRLFDRKREARADRQAYDVAFRADLYRRTAGLVGIEIDWPAHARGIPAGR